MSAVLMSLVGLHGGVEGCSDGPILIAGGRAMEDNARVFVGIDVAKLRNAVAVADGQRNGESRYLGEFDADEA